MILSVLIRKIVLFFAPIVIFYILRKIGGKHPKNRSHLSEFDKSKIVEGEIVVWKVPKLLF